MTRIVGRRRLRAASNVDLWFDQHELRDRLGRGGRAAARRALRLTVGLPTTRGARMAFLGYYSSEK